MSTQGKMEETPSPSPPPVAAPTAAPTSLSSLLGLSRQSWLRTTITFIVGLILIALLCRVVDFHSLTSILRHTHFPLLALALATLFAFYVLRAFRWTIILQGKGGFLALFS